MRPKNDTVTASEIAEFVFCPEAWRLSSLGHESANSLSRRSGARHHGRKAIAGRIAGGSIALGKLLVILALLALLLAVLRR